MNDVIDEGNVAFVCGNVGCDQYTRMVSIEVANGLETGC
jgi:hypothetical protein